MVGLWVPVTGALVGPADGAPVGVGVEGEIKGELPLGDTVGANVPSTGCGGGASDGLPVGELVTGATDGDCEATTEGTEEGSAVTGWNVGQEVTGAGVGWGVADTAVGSDDGS